MFLMRDFTLFSIFHQVLWSSIISIISYFNKQLISKYFLVTKMKKQIKISTNLYFFDQLLQIMSKQFFTFRKEFLVASSYENAKKNSTNLNFKYQQLCSTFEKQFSTFNNTLFSFSKQVDPALSGSSKRKYLFKKQLQVFTAQLLDILKQQSQYQIQCLNTLKNNNTSQFQIIFRLLQKVKENKSFCNDIQSKTNDLFQKYSQVKASFHSSKKMIENPLVFYRKQVILQQSRNLRDKIGNCNKLMQQILNKKAKSQQNIQIFQPFLSAFRKKLIKNKYQILQKVSKLMNNIKNAYLLLADTIKNCAIAKKQQFEMILMNQDDDITYLKKFWGQIHDSRYLEHHSQQNRQWLKLINLCINELDYELTSLLQIFNQLKLHFTNIRNKFAEEQLKLKQVLTQMSQIFTQYQFPNMLAKQLLNFQDIFYKKINKLIVRFEDIQSKFRSQRSNFKKKGEMFLTLIKVNKYNGKSLSQNSKQVRNQEITNLINQLTFTSLKKAILLFYDDSIFLPTQLQNKYDHNYTKRQTYDSMDVSHSNFMYRCPIDKYTPFKQEKWLWKQWRNQVEINFESYHNFFLEIQKYLQSANSVHNIKQSPLLEKQSCILLHKKNEIAGQLLLKVNCLQFNSHSLNLSIKLSQISTINVINTIFKDILVLETQKGRIQFFKLQKLDNFIQSLKEAQQKLQMGGKKNIDKKPLMNLSNQQIQVLRDRKQTLKADLPNSDNYKLLVETVISPERIDEIYELFYSDKPFNFYGKEESCFFSYTGKKAGNYNWVAEKYDNAGPQFYTSNKEVNFKNCPKFSTRKISYLHPMKPSSIPFMPKFCSNTDKRKMFWISNQQLLYEIESLTEGVPYADYFLVYLLHKISKVEGGVKIEIFYFIKWIKDTMMKSQIQSNVIPQLTQNMNTFISQVQKVLRLRGQIERGQAKLPQTPPEQPKGTPKSQPLEDISKTKLHNKVLIAAFGMLLLYNIFNFFIFDSQ